MMGDTRTLIDEAQDIAREGYEAFVNRALLHIEAREEGQPCRHITGTIDDLRVIRGGTDD